MHLTEWLELARFSETEEDRKSEYILGAYIRRLVVTNKATLLELGLDKLYHRYYHLLDLEFHSIYPSDKAIVFIADESEIHQDVLWAIGHYDDDDDDDDEEKHDEKTKSTV